MYHFAVLDVTITRSMYLRRLRTLADHFLSPGGRLEQVSKHPCGASIILLILQCHFSLVLSDPVEVVPKHA